MPKWVLKKGGVNTKKANDPELDQHAEKQPERKLPEGVLIGEKTV